MAQLFIYDADGNSVPVGPDNPVPTTGGGGGGMEPADITGAAPVTVTDNGDGTVTIGVTTGTTAGTVATGNHTHAASAITSGTLDAARIPTLAVSKVSGLQDQLDALDRQADHVEVDGTDLATLTASVTAIRDALVAAGLMAAA